MRVVLLGPVELLDDADRPFPVGGPRLRALLARLALNAGRPVRAEALVDDLWGDIPPSGAVNALQSLVSRLRQAVARGAAADAHQLIESQAGGYRLALPSERVDALWFEQLAGQGHRELMDGNAQDATITLRSALALWHGTPLAGVEDVPFAARSAGWLEELWLTATGDRVEADLMLGRHAEVVTDLQALCARHPWHERLAGQLIRALAGTGRQADALAAYRHIRAVLADELGIDPSAELESLHAAVLRQDPALSRAAGPLAAARPARPTNLRAHLTRLVGREEIIADVSAAMARTRLVTLVGPGGVGKTRVAEEVGGRLVAQFADGVCFAALAPVRDPADAADAVAAALDIRGRTQDGAAVGAVPDPTSRLEAVLADQETLIVLDNCEHVIDAAARLVDRLISSCPGLRVLATSREPLGITGETVWPVPPLAVPPEGTPAAEILAYPSVRLLADRAAAVRPGFAWCQADAAVAAQICRRLDGLPLALELAAARLRSLPAAQVLARLDDRFRLLAGGSRTAQARHQALHTVVEWSWDLLTPAERILARRLSVLPGGATLEAAARVCGGIGTAAGDVPDVLAALVEKSLVEMVLPDSAASGSADARYRMLETVRAFCGEKLGEAGEAAEVSAAQARFFLDLAETAAPHLRAADQLAWIARLAEERDNLLSALRWAIGTGDAETAVRLSAALSGFWILRGIQAEGVTWVRDALTMTGPAPAGARAVASASYALSLMAAGQPPGDALTQFRQLVRGQDPAVRDPVVVLADIVAAMMDGDHSGTARTLDRYSGHRDPWARAIVVMFRGFAAEQRGEGTAVEQHLTQAGQEFRAIGERWGLVMALIGAAEAALLRGDHEAARAASGSALEAASELGAPREALGARLLLGQVLAYGGDLPGGRRELSVVVATGHGFRETQILALCLLGDIARWDNSPATARARYDQAAAWLQADESAPARLRAVIETGLGWISLATGDQSGAQDRFSAAAQTGADNASPALLAAAAEGLAATARAAAVEQAAGRTPPAGLAALERAAGLLGLAAGLRGVADRGHPDVAALTAAVRQALDPAVFEQAYQRGTELSAQPASRSLAPGAWPVQARTPGAGR
jgi:predicted ATPase/DNA-binding SARP family transcriptional activator